VACERSEPLQDGKGERGSLAGAGLGARHEIAPGEHERNRLFLYRRGLGVTEFRDRRAERRN
jgi:hypothetical protein